MIASFSLKDFGAIRCHSFPTGRWYFLRNFHRKVTFLGTSCNHPSETGSSSMCWKLKAVHWFWDIYFHMASLYSDTLPSSAFLTHKPAFEPQFEPTICFRLLGWANDLAGWFCLVFCMVFTHSWTSITRTFNKLFYTSNSCFKDILNPGVWKRMFVFHVFHQQKPSLSSASKNERLKKPNQQMNPLDSVTTWQSRYGKNEQTQGRLHTLGIQSPCQRMIGVYNHLLS